ncbi:hypothetical protein Plhal304r1_c033g0104261 [Plasmopara halstedii]
MRLLLIGLELFGPSENDQYRHWLDQASKSTKKTPLTKQWNVILLKDLFAELQERTVILCYNIENMSVEQSKKPITNSCLSTSLTYQCFTNYLFVPTDTLRFCNLQVISMDVKDQIEAKIFCLYFEAMEICQRRVDELPVQQGRHHLELERRLHSVTLVYKKLWAAEFSSKLRNGFAALEKHD